MSLGKISVIYSIFMNFFFNILKYSLGSNEGNLRKIWKKLKEILEKNYGNSVINLGIFEENLSNRYWEDFEEITRNSKK